MLATEPFTDKRQLCPDSFHAAELRQREIGIKRPLTSGPDQLRLRRMAKAEQQTLDLGLSGMLGAVTAKEDTLAKLLGAGFECAPIVSAQSVETIRDFLLSVRRYFLDIPDEAVEHASAYQSAIEELERASRLVLAEEVGR